MTTISIAICWILGHKYYGRGWTSDVFDDAVPDNHIRNIWGCRRCRKIAFTDEAVEDVGKRFDGYRKKHGDAIVHAPEFGPPRP